MTNFLAYVEFWVLATLNFWRLRTARISDQDDVEVLYYRKLGNLSGQSVVLSIRTRANDKRRFFFRSWGDTTCQRCGLNFANREQYEAVTHTCTLDSMGDHIGGDILGMDGYR